MFILADFGESYKYGVTLMETVKLEERLPGREIYKVKWTRLTDYKGINTQLNDSAGAKYGRGKK